LATLCLRPGAIAELIVDLDATTEMLGAFPVWSNAGTLGDDFEAGGSPEIQTIAGVNAVTLAGGADFYVGPVAPSSLAGTNPSRTIEAWVFNPSIAAEETILAWGRRDGPDGTNIAFNYGNNGAFGAIGHWGGPDIGWNNAGGAPTAGIWHYLVYTYDGGGIAAAGTTRVYADGVLQNSEFLGTLDTHDGFAFVIGGQNDGAGSPFGFNSGLSIAKIRVRDEVLSDAEIAAQFAAEKPQFFPSAFLSGSRILSTSKFAFTITDAPSSATDPGTFEVTVAGVRAGWQVAGGEGIINGSITTPTINVTEDGPVELTLQHRYNFEDGGTPWDGGVVQISIDGGAFETLDDANFSQNGYFPDPLIGNGVLLGVRAFNGLSPGFANGDRITSIATIPGISSGDSLRIRFLGAWDDGFTPDGIDWEIGGVTVKVAETTLLDEDFSAGDGSFTAESTAPGASWGFIPASQPVLGTLVVTKDGGVTTLCVPIDWVPGSSYNFTISGMDTLGSDLVFQTTVATTLPPLGVARTWPATIPGPLGTSGAWGVRTYLNEGINGAEDLTAALEFLASADGRTPELSPDTVVDSQEPNLNFVDPSTNNPATLWGVIPCSRPFPGDALSTATNGDAARDDNHVVTSAHGTIVITEESDYTFNLRGDDGFMFRIEAANGLHPTFVAASGAGFVDEAAQNILYFPTGTGDANTRGVVHLKPGIYNLEYVTWEGAGGFFSQDSSDTDTWGAVGYMTSRVEPIPYPAMVGNWSVLSTLPEVASGSIANADASVDAAVAADAVAATSLWAQINFNDPGFGGTGRIAGDVPWPRDTAEVDDNNYAMRMSGILYIPEDGDYLLGFQGDDGSNLIVADASVWRAYNDSAFKAGQTNAANVSTIGLGRSFEGQGSSGLLGTVNTGASTGVTATYTEFLTTGSVNSAGDAASYAPGSDAEQLFGSYVDIAGNMSYGDSPGWYVDLTLTGLDPAKSYMFAATANRDGGLAYANRVTNWSLMGADSAIDASSAGVHQVSNYSVEFSTGDNSLGLVARWREIRAGADGTIVIRTTHGVGAAGGGIADADAFRGYAGGAFVLAEQSGFSALVENATGGGIIGRANTVAHNSGSLGASADSDPDTSVIFEQPGALAGDADTSVSATPEPGPKVTVPFNAAMSPADENDLALPYTVEAWARPDSLAGGAQAVVNSMIAGVNQNPANGDDRSGFSLRLNADTWQFYVGGTTGGTFYEIAVAPGSAVAGEWQHVVGVWDGTNVKIYINGELGASVEAVTHVPRANFAAPLYIGKRGFGDWLFSGGVDEVAIYNGVLDDATILSHYENGIDPARATPYETLVQASAPLGYWRLNETIQPRSDLSTITTDVPTGDSSTVGRIFLAAGDYPISSTFWEAGGGSYYEIFASRDLPGGCVPMQVLRDGGWPSILDNPGLPLVPHPAPKPPVVVGNLVFNPDSSLSLTFESRPGKTYTLQTSTDLIAIWTELDDNIEATGLLTTVTGIPGVSFYYDPTEPRRYYRIVLNP
jgi:hypothetical protein